jgi:hypothetical protein
MDFEVERAVDYILSGGLERDRRSQKKDSGPRGMLNTIKHYTRSKSPFKQKPSPSNYPEVTDISDDEDREMQLAMQMSLQQNVPSRGPSPNPLNSSTSISGEQTTPQFRPATGTDYPEGSWGMVLSEQSQQETGTVDEQGNMWVSSSPEEEPPSKPAHKRIRQEEQPVVLQPWGANDIALLSALLTILHKIPRVREALLLASPRDGGDNAPGETWWNGGSSVKSLNSGDLEEGVDSTGLAVLRETAKIMAFLDDTERAYGR